jgi:hypothetical protein
MKIEAKIAVTLEAEAQEADRVEIAGTGRENIKGGIKEV